MERSAETIATVESIAGVRSWISSRRSAGTVALVPTMGALHAGHARLIEAARRECNLVVVSLFVNPLQFDRQDDLDRYPRTIEADRSLCERLGVDLLFAPPAREMYPSKPFCTVKVDRIGDHLCGRFRPGHFEGVATVVLKLLQIVQPDRAYLGQKDAQQLAIIRHLANDFNLPMSIVAVPTVRESDGLALSSRNQHLSSEERALAVALYEALCEAQRQIARGERDAERVKKAAAATVPGHASLKLEYLEVVDPDDMQPVSRIDGTVCIAGALWVGTTRLIDNILCTP